LLNRSVQKRAVQQATWVGRYSHRNVLDGFTRAARHAGAPGLLFGVAWSMPVAAVVACGV